MKGNSPLFSNFAYDKIININNNFGNQINSYSTSPLHGDSQKFLEKYSVYSKMMKKDILSGVYDIKNGYTKNPTSKKLSDMVNGNYIVNKNFNKQLPYVITIEGEIIVGERNGNGKGYGRLPTPHPTLIGGRDPKVKVAGILDIRGGKIYSFDNQSGHYRPHIKSLKYSNEAFKNFPKHIKFIGGIDRDGKKV